MATNFDFGLDDNSMPQKFSWNFIEDFNTLESSGYGTGRSGLEHSALDPSSASSIPSWPLPPTSPYVSIRPLLPYNNTPAMPSITTAHAKPSMVKSPISPSSKITARPAPKEHSAEDWERHRLTFTQLYTTEDKPLKKVMEIMENEHKFRATSRQYKRRIEQWKLDKNIKENDMRVILRKDLKRKREGKNSEFRIGGREIEPKKIQRFVQRYKVTEESILEFNVETPFYIACDTPTPTIVDDSMQHNMGEEDSTTDLTILSSPVVELDQDRETQIIGTRKRVLNQFIRKIGGAIPIDSRFDLSAFKYPPELDGLSDKRFRQLIRMKVEQCYNTNYSKPVYLSPFGKNTVTPPSISRPLLVPVYLENVNQVPQSIILLALYFFKQSHTCGSFERRQANAVCTGHTFEFILYCSIVYYCTERDLVIGACTPWSLLSLDPIYIGFVLKFLNLGGSVAPAMIRWLRSNIRDLFVVSKLRIDDWNNFVERTEQEVKDLDDLDRSAVFCGEPKSITTGRSGNMANLYGDVRVVL